MWRAALHLHLFRPQPSSLRPRGQTSQKPKKPKPYVHIKPTNNKTRFAGNNFQLGKRSKEKSLISKAFPLPGL